MQKKQSLHPKTQLLNKEQKSLSKEARYRVLSWLKETFPAAFDVSQQMRPLKIGILDEILAYVQENSIQFSKAKIREALVLFTRRIDYLTCVKAQEMRIDLKGNPIAKVTEKEARMAAEKIKLYIEKTSKNFDKDSIDKAQKFLANQIILPKNNSNTRVTIKHKVQKKIDASVLLQIKKKLGIINS